MGRVDVPAARAPVYPFLRSNLVRVFPHPENVEVAYEEIVARLMDMIGSESEAAKCIGIAMYFERHEGGVDPADRFLFEKHVPVVWPLEGDERVLHEEFLAALMERTIGRE